MRPSGPSESQVEGTGLPTALEVKEQKIYRTFGLTDAEYEHIVELLVREPNYVETGIFSVMWSEHCSYKSSKKVLRRFPTDGPSVLQGPGENAGIVDIGDGLAVAFKIESHNHPTAIEPYQGAATGVGGIIRDVFTMGARPIALLNSLRFGELDDAHTRYLFAESVAGIGGYGNCIGIPTVGGEVVFDNRYQHNPLVNAMCVGLMTHEQIARGSASGVGNPVLIVGARTGRDGIHGATFASAIDPHAKERSAVQVGDPFMGKLLLEACLELIATGKVVGIQDMGAAGLTSSAAEMASRAGSGLTIDVAQVPCRESGMNPYEIMLSESQERMLVVMQQGQEEVATTIFEKWNLHATVIGQVTDDQMLRVLEHGDVAAEIPVFALVDEAPVLDRPALRPDYLDALQGAPQITELGDVVEKLCALLARPTIASKEWVYDQYDSMVRTETFVRPGSDAAVVGIPGTQKAIALVTDGNGRHVYLDPYTGGLRAVAEAARNIVCTGAQPLAVTDCLNYGNPEKPEIFYQLERSADGLSKACEAFGTPVISGNVSLYNESHGVDIYPTPVIGMVGLLEDRSQLITSAFRTAGDEIFVLGDLERMQTAGLGGSEYLFLEGVDQALQYRLPEIHLEAELALQKCMLALAKENLVQSAHDVSDGGLLVAIAESAMAGNLGAKIQLNVSRTNADHVLSNEEVLSLFFGEGASLIVLTAKAGSKELIARIAATHSVPLLHVGSIEDSSHIHVSIGDKVYMQAPIERLQAAWRGAITSWMKR
ncbi:phosphoribosylformylglycinamidine synthase subunit PurL [Sulfoacidibacillus ferrooxidans]|uniref:Phosphoribosylformylglycinamidine synthase subunit PurL n=1 Tax=Sulfoacidibacillus ferrooxidans TaxID=2005001 RepID=A0A9X2AB96_9BACL|nr:phosphoribosylformylglycinamidine synthase subunit PurL [Sulfoacidibacillus ferrooxidans]MCI0182708.1 Phosphoribosylformylglycinamidine synthase subunit PurL [Sulfoacidibacillus ferrooxidans]